MKSLPVPRPGFERKRRKKEKGRKRGFLGQKNFVEEAQKQTQNAEELFFNHVKNGNTGMMSLRKALQGCPWVNRSGKDAVHYLRLEGEVEMPYMF